MVWIWTWEAVFLVVNSILSFTLNSLIGYLIYRNRALQNSFNATILNASFADILVSLNVLVTAVESMVERGEKIVDSTWCDITGFINLISFVGSVMSLAAVSVNRYFLVCRSHLYPEYFTKKGTAIYIAFVWIISALISSPPFYGWSEFSYHKGKSICFVNWISNKSYMIFMILICFCGPIAATLLSLVFILKTKGRAEASLESKQNEYFGSTCDRTMARKKKREQNDRKIAISIAIVVLAFFVAWSPFVIVMFVQVYWDGLVPRWADIGSFFLGCLNSTANPIIYMTVNTNFRKALNRCLRNRVISDQGSQFDTGLDSGR